MTTNPIDFLGIISTLAATQNPEIWHVDHNTHPGLAWVIKTVVPKVEFADDSSFEIVKLWVTICIDNPRIAMMSNDAYDWDGNRLDEWATIWIKHGFDIDITTDDNLELTYTICRFEKGVAKQAKSLIDSIGRQLAHLTDIAQREELLELLEACEALASYTTDQDSAALRETFKVVDDGI